MGDPAMAAPRTPGSSSSSSSQLNLPPSMSRSALALDSLTPPRHIDRMINYNHNQLPLRTIYSNRFIPSISGSNFPLFDISTGSNSPSEGREDGSSAYATLLQTALFGPETPEKRDLVGAPNRNIFRYSSETRRSMHSLSPCGFDDSALGVSPIPVKTPRKVPRSPYKVRSLLNLINE